MLTTNIILGACDYSQAQLNSHQILVAESYGGLYLKKLCLGKIKLAERAKLSEQAFI